MTEKSKSKITLHSKLYAIKDTVKFSITFLRAFCEFTLQNDNWKEILTPLTPSLDEFIQKRDGDVNNFGDLVQFGGLYIISLEQFFRSEFIKENLPLTEAEKKEVSAEILEAFNDPKASAEIRKAASVVGWKLITIMDQFIDHEAVNTKVAGKLEAIHFNFKGLDLTDNILKTAGVIDKAYLISHTLSERMGVSIDENNQPFTNNPEEKDKLEKFLAAEDTSMFKEEDKNELEDLKILSTPLGKLLTQCTKLQTL